MASHPAARAARRFVLPLTLFIVVVLVRHLPTKSLQTTSNFQLKNQIHIEGRWKHIRASLGLPPLPDIISFPPGSNSDIPTITQVPPTRMSRFDLKRKRSIELAAKESKHSQLHFADDAMKEQSASLEQIAASFRAIALAEKGIAIEQARARLVRQGQVERGLRRSSSWGPRAAKIQLGKR